MQECSSTGISYLQRANMEPNLRESSSQDLKSSGFCPSALSLGLFVGSFELWQAICGEQTRTPDPSDNPAGTRQSRKDLQAHFGPLGKAKHFLSLSPKWGGLKMFGLLLSPFNFSKGGELVPGVGYMQRHLVGRRWKVRSRHFSKGLPKTLGR